MPISSSAHIQAIPRLLGWNDAGLVAGHDRGPLDAELRKAFEVSVHAGTAAALLIALRAELSGLGPRAAGLIAVAAAPPAVAGYAFERPVERHLGAPPAIAVGLVAGGLALALADRQPQRRRSAEATVSDAAWLGVAQALALIPGVSRSGATLAAARVRGFTRPDAHRLARHTGLPVIAGATALKGARLLSRGADRETSTRLIAGAASAFVSTLASARLIARIDRDRPLWPYAAYRIAVAGGVLARLRHQPPTDARQCVRDRRIRSRGRRHR